MFHQMSRQAASYRDETGLFPPIDIVYNFPNHLYNKIQSIFYLVDHVRKTVSSGMQDTIYIVFQKDLSSSFTFICIFFHVFRQAQVDVPDILQGRYYFQSIQDKFYGDIIILRNGFGKMRVVNFKAIIFFQYIVSITRLIFI
jgi:hypothetical protein